MHKSINNRHTSTISFTATDTKLPQRVVYERIPSMEVNGVALFYRVLYEVDERFIEIINTELDFILLNFIAAFATFISRTPLDSVDLNFVFTAWEIYQHISTRLKLYFTGDARMAEMAFSELLRVILTIPHGQAALDFIQAHVILPDFNLFVWLSNRAVSAAPVTRRTGNVQGASKNKRKDCHPPDRK